jgi:twitching motility protein PilT
VPHHGGFRVNAFKQSTGIGAVFRVIPSKIPTLEQIIAPPIFKKILELSSGLILIAGQAGSGKTTTLAAIINYINMQRNLHIITIEDPIEFVHPNKGGLISQRQLYRDARTYPRALRSALREDPDVIIIGEIRDLESLHLALNAAETGHLVLSTVHANSAQHAVSRIVNIFEESERSTIRAIVADSLQAVICQTLIDRIDGGRIAAFEIMLATNSIRHLIRQDSPAQMYSVMQISSELGMCTMEQSIDKLISQNIITAEAAHHIHVLRAMFE